MRIYLGGHLNFYHPQQDKWLQVTLTDPTRLAEILDRAGIPFGEIQLVVVNGEIVELETVIVSAHDEVKVFSAVGGG